MVNKYKENLYSNMALICGIIFTIWGVILYAGSFANLWYQWQTPEYGHGILLPIISAIWGLYLLQKSQIRFNDSYIGLLTVGGALAVNCLGMIISNNWLSNMSVVVFVIGIVWSFLGFETVKRTAPALILLFFAVPLPATILPALTADLQLISSSMGVGLLKFVGIPVYQEGNIIDLGDHKLDVAVACSGLQYLFPLMSLGYLVAFLSFQSWWKRIFLFLSSIPITLAMNAARIALSGVIYTWFGSDAIEGMLHYFEGYVVFALCLIVLLGVKYGLGFIPPREKQMTIFETSFSLKNLKETRSDQPRLRLYAGLFLIFVIFSGLSYYVQKQHDIEVDLPRKNFFDFPLSIGNWKGTKSQLSWAELQTLNLTDHFVGNYTYESNSAFAPINLYIAYYEKQTQENSIHSPEICLPGSGWIVTSHDIHSVDGLSVNKQIIQKGSERLLIYFWFREAGYDAATNWEIKRLLLINSLRNGRTDGSLIRITAPVKDNDDLNVIEDQMDDFLRNMRTQLHGYLPAPSYF